MPNGMPSRKLAFRASWLVFDKQRKLIREHFCSPPNKSLKNEVVLGKAQRRTKK